MLLIFRRSFWRSLWFAILRSRKDKRARAAIFAVVLGIAIVAAEAFYVFVLPA
jgi:hypothetical protein